MDMADAMLMTDGTAVLEKTGAGAFVKEGPAIRLAGAGGATCPAIE